MEPTRVNKYCSMCGYCSRREADALIAEGKILVNGQPATPGQKVTPEDQVTVDGVRILPKDEKVVLAFYKPVGIVCTTSDKDRAENVVDYLQYPIRVYPVGRLDKESEGLLLLTNDGELTNHILKARYYHEKEYIVTVDKPVTAAFLDQMAEGVSILDTVTRHCQVKQKGKQTFSIILTQGLNRQIRRMCQALGYQVTKLKRVRILNILLEDLQPGEYRKIEGEQLEQLYRLTQTGC
ncbi:MAG: pseudouridine synthase [Lachnospiraceae bacterium]|nr:pseudouridine synthase [Lachnospiraceae bacterium]